MTAPPPHFDGGGGGGLAQSLGRRWGQTTLLMAAIALYALGGLWILSSFTSTRDMTTAMKQAMVVSPVQAASSVLTLRPQPPRAARAAATITRAHALDEEEEAWEEEEEEEEEGWDEEEEEEEEEEEDEFDEEEEEEGRGAAAGAAAATWEEEDEFEFDPPPRPPGAGTLSKPRKAGGGKGEGGATAAHTRPEAFERCGDWQEEYMELHRQILAGDRPPRYLVAVVSQSGLADQIVGIMSLFFWALLTKRAFQITIGHQPMPPLEAAFDGPYINWTRPAGDPAVLTEHLARPFKGERRYPKSHRDVKNIQDQYGSMYLINKNNSFWSASNLNNLPKGQADKPYLFMASNRGRVFRLFDNPHHRRTLFDMGLRPETAFACGFRFLFSPNLDTRFETGWQLAEERLLPESFPVDDEEQEAALQSAAESVLRIGIQIRVGDFVFNKPGKANQLQLEDYMSYFDCAREIEGHKRTNETTKVVWYLVSDSQRLKELALEKFGPDLLVTSTEASRHVICAKDGLTDCNENAEMAGSLTAAAADMMGLAETDYIILTRKSGFGKVAAWLNMRWHNVWWLTPGEAKTKVCGPRGYVHLEYMADKWSGL